MTNSDIIAIIAIAVSGITTVATLIFGYLTNRSNNRAKLHEMLYAKRLETLRELYESLSLYTRQVHDYTKFLATDYGSYDTDTVNQKLDYILKTRSELQSLYYKNRIYIPEHIEKAIIAAAEDILPPPEIFDSPEKEKIAKTMTRKQFNGLSNVLNLMKNELHYK